MGIQDRDYYREHAKQRKREEENEAFFRPAPKPWFTRLLILALMCGCAYLGAQVFRLRAELAKAERIIQTQTMQMKADRQRVNRVP